MRNRIKNFLVTLLVPLAFLLASWEQIGPWGGDRHELLVDPTDGSIVYVGGAGGFIHVSSDSGQTWSSAAEDFIHGALSIETIAAHPEKPGEVWAGSLLGIHKSDDYGENWTMSYSDTNWCIDIEISNIDSDLLYASFMHRPSWPDSEFIGILRSSDGGENWHRFADSLPPCISLRLGQSADGVVFATSVNAGLYRLYGDRWRRIGFGLPDSLTIVSPDPHDAEFLAVGSLREWAFFSTDTGHTFTAMPLCGPDHVTISAVTDIEFDPNVPGNLWIASLSGDEQPFYGGELAIDGDNYSAFSTDRGTSWYHTASGGFFRYHIDQHSDIITDGTAMASARIFFCTGGTGIIMSNMGGFFPEPSNEGLGGVFLNTINIIDERLYTGAEKGVDQLDLATSEWRYLHTKMPDQEGYLYTWDIKQDPLNENILWIAKGMLSHWWIENRGLYFYDLSDSSVSRDSSLIGMGIWKILFHPIDPNTIFLATQTDGILRSTDRGSSWHDYSTGIAENSVTDIEYSNPTDPIFFCSTRQDSGSQWHDSYPGEDGNIYRLDGDSWTDIFTIGEYACRRIEVDPTNPDRIWGVFYNYGIWRTENGGIGWDDCNDGFENTRVRALVVDRHNPNLLFAGLSPFGVYYSDNYGESWHEFNEGLYCGTVDVLHLDSANDMLYAGTLGGSTFRRSVEELMVSGENRIQKPEIEIDLYPNPFNSHITISLAISHRNYVEISIFDIQGRIIDEPFADFLPAGSHNIQWNLKNESGDAYSSGVYLLKACIGNKEIIRKFQLLR